MIRTTADRISIPAVVLALLGMLVPLAVCPASGGKKAAPPPKAAQDKALALIHELYAADYKEAARVPADKAKLAALLLQEARDTLDYPAGRFVLLREAKDLATQAGDIGIALQAIEEMGLSFQYEPAQLFAMKVGALESASKADSSDAAHRAAVEASLILLEEVLADDDFANATRLVKAAQVAAKKLRSITVLANVKKREEEVQRLEQDYAKVKIFVETLKSMPADAKASLEVGKYLAFTRSNWKKGLDLLAHGSDPLLKVLAAAELQNSKDAGKQLALGKGWFAASMKLNGMAKINVLLHAYQWLQQAEYRLKGKEHDQAQTLMDTVLAAIPPEYRMGEIATEVRRFEGHQGPVFGVAFSPDGRKIATASQDGTVRIWDTKTGQTLRTLSGHGAPVWTVAFSPDGRRVASGGFDNTIRVWDLVSGGEVRHFTGHTDYVRSVAFTPDGERLLSGGDDRTVRLWNVATGKEIFTLKGHNHFVWSVAISADGTRGVSGSLDKTARVWDLDTGVRLEVLAGHTDTVLGVAMLPGGGRVLTASSDKTARLWDVQTGKVIHTLDGHKGYVTSVAVTPDGRRALTGCYDSQLRLWDLKTGKEVRRLPGHSDIIWSVAFSADGRWAVSGSHDKMARLWGAAK